MLPLMTRLLAHPSVPLMGYFAIAVIYSKVGVQTRTMLPILLMNVLMEKRVHTEMMNLSRLSR